MIKLKSLLSEKKLRVFDFDDTLVKTKAKVYITTGGKKRVFTPGEYAVYKPNPNDKFDFSVPSYQIKSSWIHFEESDGTTIHRHASAVTLGYLFETMNIIIDEQCYLFPDGRQFCTNEDYSLKYYINHQIVKDINDYVFEDGDRILITYGSETPEQIEEQLIELDSQIIKG